MYYVFIIYPSYIHDILTIVGLCMLYPNLHPLVVRMSPGSHGVAAFRLLDHQRNSGASVPEKRSGDATVEAPVIPVI